MATYSVSCGSDYVTYRLSGGVSGESYRVYLRLSSSSSMLEDTGYTLSASSFPYTVSGLSPSTSYTCNVGVMKSDGTWYNIGSQTVTTTAAPGGTRPQYFNWKSSAVNGIQATKVSGSITTSDYLFVNGETSVSGKTTYLTASRWNGLLTNIRDVATFKSKTVSLPVNVAAGDSILASSYNTVITALRTLNSSFATSSYVASTTATAGKTKILAGHFNLLQDWINSVT